MSSNNYAVDGPSPELLPGESRLIAGPDCPNGVQVSTRVRQHTPTLDKLFTITLNDKNADTQIADILDARFSEMDGDIKTINLVFEHPLYTYFLPVFRIDGEFRDELWESLSALRILGFTTIIQHQS